MALQFDKYVPQEWLNTIFTDAQNCEIEVRPSREGYNAPMFYLKKRRGLETKTGWKQWYKVREWEYTNLWYDTLTKEDESMFFFSGIIIKPKKKSYISRVKKHNLCNATVCYLIGSDGEVIAKRDFADNVASIDVQLEKDKEYKLVVYNRDDTKFYSVKQAGLTYPISRHSMFDIIAGLWGKSLKEVKTTLTSGTRISTYYSYWITYKATEDIFLTKVVKAEGSTATKCTLSIENNGAWSDKETVIYSWNEAVFPKWYWIKKGTKFSIKNKADSYWYFVRYDNSYPVNDDTIVKPIWSVYEWSNWDNDLPDPANKYLMRFEIEKIEFNKAFNRSWDTTYNFTDIAVSESEEVDLKEHYWKTIGDIVEGKMFDDKLHFYTNKWYLYKFDWTTLDIVEANKQIISYIWTGRTFKLKNDNPDYILRYGNTFTFEKEWVLTNIQVRLRKVGTLSPSCFVKCYVSKDATRQDVIVTSETTFDYSSFTDDFKNFKFKFHNLEIRATERMFFSIEVYFTTAAWYIEIDGSTSNTYSWHSSKKYNSQSNSWENISSWMIGFSVGSTTPMYVDNKDYDDCMLLVDYLWGWQYPTDTVEYTVTAYDKDKGITTVAEATLDDKFIGKYMYIKSWSTMSRFQERVVSLVTDRTKLTTPTGFTNEPQAWDKIIFYNKMEQQIWIPQFRKWSSTEDKKFIFTYSKNWDVVWRYMPDKRQLTFWDNRIIQMTKDNQSLIASSNIDYEIPILNSVSFGNSKAISMSSYGWYLMVFFQSKIGLVKKDIVNQESWEFNYTYQDLLDVWLYSKDSFLIQWWNLYVFADDKRLYSVDLTTVSVWQIIGKLSDQGWTLINYFDKFDWGSVKMHFQSGILYLVYRDKSWRSEVFKYYDTFKSWIQDKYRYSWNFFNFLYTLKQDKFIPSGNLVYKMAGLTDNWKPIEQHIKMYWPVQWIFDLFTLIMCKIRLWLSEYWLAGKVIITIWWYKPYKKTRDIESIDIIKEINEVVDEDGTMWSWIVGDASLWWDSGKLSRLMEIFSEIIDISVKVGKRGSYLTVELVNTTKRQLLVGGVVWYYNTENPMATYNKWVLN